ncbi:MAG: sulfotransferase family protein [Planctomycetota bacterium]
MMMQLLAAGGIPPLTDEQRTADDDNPRGYFELESVKQIAKDASFLDGAPGHAVKLIHALITKLPERHPYRVVFMRRPIDEVLASQAKMLARTGKKGASLPPDKLRVIFEKQVTDTLAALAKRDDVELLEVDYPSVIADPPKAVDALNAFLGGELDRDAMLAVIDPELYRNKA